MKRPDNEHVDQPKSSRRRFLVKLWFVLGGLALAEIIALVVGFLRPRKPSMKATDLGDIMEAGSVERFPVHSVTAFVRGKFYLCRLEDGGFLALSRKCTHLGCTVPWDSKANQFACPCHASVYDIRGEVISPPAPRALDMYQVFIENNIVKVDISKPIKRSRFLKEQVIYPEGVPSKNG
jgi:cytochrome b6-f complex iron-sulfur subunit